MEKSSFWRADLMTDKAWSLHPADRSEQFYNLLPEILDCVSCNEFPDEQKGFYDLLVNQWANFINNKTNKNIEILILCLILVAFSTSVLFLQNLKAPWVDELPTTESA